MVQVANSPNSVIQQRNLFLIGIYLNSLKNLYMQTLDQKSAWSENFLGLPCFYSDTLGYWYVEGGKKV